MTRLAMLHDAINLSQGFPDFAAPEEVKEAARQAIADDVNQYPIAWGAEGFRRELARNYRERYGMDWVDPERDITVTMRVDGGDDGDARRPRSGRRGRRLRAVLRELRSGHDHLEAVPRTVTLRARLDVRRGRARCRVQRAHAGIVIDTPNNPTGKVFSARSSR